MYFPVLFTVSLISALICGVLDIWQGTKDNIILNEWSYTKKQLHFIKEKFTVTRENEISRV